MKRAFTLIEVLVVVAIIALLIAILIPSLSAARQGARTTKCLANMSNLPKAVLIYTAEHKGYAQLIGRQDEWTVVDPGHSKYSYQTEAFGQPGQVLQAWPIAYASYLGERSLRRMEQFFTTNFNADRAFYLGKFGMHEIFMCPSDSYGVNSAWSPFDMFGVFSYAANEDVFGITNPNNNEGQPWKDGTTGDTTPRRAKRLEGRMDHIVRPSEVALFCDGGNEQWKRRQDVAGHPPLLITGGAGMHGPYLENYEWIHDRLPHFRHSKKGGLATAMADGSGRIVKPVEWTADGYVKLYSPRVRISPYQVGKLNPSQP